MQVNGLVGDLTFAARLCHSQISHGDSNGGGTEGGTEEVVSTLFNNDTIAPMSYRNFGTASRLMAAAEQMFTTGVSQWPIERNLLTTGLTAAVAKAFHAPEAPLLTPELDVCYQPKA